MPCQNIAHPDVPQRVTYTVYRFVLQLNVQTVWLKQEFGRRCYFPDQTGNFQFDQEVGHAVFSLVVEGAPRGSQSGSCSTGPATNTLQPFYKPIASKKECAFNVKVVKATMNKLANGKVEFQRLEQAHIRIDDRSANVHAVNSAVQAKWGAEFVVVTGDGLEVDDSAGTQQGIVT